MPVQRWFAWCSLLGAAYVIVLLQPDPAVFALSVLCGAIGALLASQLGWTMRLNVRADAPLAQRAHARQLKVVLRRALLRDLSLSDAAAAAFHHALAAIGISFARSSAAREQRPPKDPAWPL